MRLSEIKEGWTAQEDKPKKEQSKTEFHRKLADPAAQELVDIGKELNNAYGGGYTFHVVGEDKESAMIEGQPPRMEVEMSEGNPVLSVKRRIYGSDHWVWDTWEGDAEEYISCYVIRKT